MVKWGESPCVGVPRRHVWVHTVRATNRAPEGVEVRLFDQDAPENNEPEEGQ